MDKKVTQSSSTQKKALFSRIALRLSLPLFILAAVFTGLQLTNQINAMNNLNKIESQLAFQELQQTLTQEIGDGSNPIQFQENLKNKLQTLLNDKIFDSLVVFDLIEKKIIFGKDTENLTVLDLKTAEESLFQSRNLGKPYLIRINRGEQHLMAYIPFQGPRTDNLYIAKAAFPMANLNAALKTSKYTLVIILSFIMLTGIAIGKSLASSIVKPIKTLNEATRLIMLGQLGKHVAIHTGDEIEMLAYTFNEMTDKLIEMKRRAEDANPLTQLPGNQGIFHELQKRTVERQKFVLFHVDLDRFKVFNDRFGLARGDEVIKKTAEVLKAALKEKGTPGDFLGHQGGDDFVIITRPNHAVGVAEFVCQHFDKDVLIVVYRKEDLERGYILEVDRRKLAETGEESMVKFPLLAITLAGVSTAKRDFADYFECMTAAAAVKKVAKKTIPSSYMIQE